MSEIFAFAYSAARLKAMGAPRMDPEPLFMLLSFRIGGPVSAEWFGSVDALTKAIHILRPDKCFACCGGADDFDPEDLIARVCGDGAVH